MSRAVRLLLGSCGPAICGSSYCCWSNASAKASRLAAAFHWNCYRHTFDKQVAAHLAGRLRTGNPEWSHHFVGGHALNQPKVPFPRWEALLMIAVTVSATMITAPFVDRSLTQADQIASFGAYSADVNKHSGRGEYIIPE
jgi:hypothetical protein